MKLLKVTLLGTMLTSTAWAREAKYSFAIEKRIQNSISQVADKLGGLNAEKINGVILVALGGVTARTLVDMATNSGDGGAVVYGDQEKIGKKEGFTYFLGKDYILTYDFNLPKDKDNIQVEVLRSGDQWKAISADKVLSEKVFKKNDGKVIIKASWQSTRDASLIFSPAELLFGKNFKEVNGKVLNNDRLDRDDIYMLQAAVMKYVRARLHRTDKKDFKERIYDANISRGNSNQLIDYMQRDFRERQRLHELTGDLKYKNATFDSYDNILIYGRVTKDWYRKYSSVLDKTGFNKITQE